jgi:hypothetical protein
LEIRRELFGNLSNPSRRFQFLFGGRILAYDTKIISALNIEMTDKMKATGSKAEVFHGTAKHTSGGLHKKDLMKHKGRIISRKKHAAGKKAIKHLRALGYIAKKGTFKLMRKSMAHGKKHGKRHTRRRGGAAGVPSTSATAPAPMK